uniref:M60 family metallopeptidase n=1 Tax=Akkermansia muciniphila TaxID=239935 RepID=UPI003FD717C8
MKEAASSQSPYSGNHSVKQAVDGSMESANWHVPGVHHVEGEFVFEVPETIHYIIFSGADFNEIAVSAMSGSSWKDLGKFDIGGSRMIRFKKPLQKVRKIRLTVDYPEGSSPSFTVREISFYKRVESVLNRKLLKVFKDTSCSSINPRCTLTDLKALPEFLQMIAKKIKSGDYEDKEFRIASYKAYSHPEFAAKVRNINALNKFDNPTGIVAEKGDEILVFVGPTHGEDIGLASVSPAGIESSSYPLNEGVNKIRINRSGLLYVMYHTDISTPKKPITVHIPVGSGIVNGYFDVTRHTDKDWKRMISNAPHSMFDIVGRNSMMILHTKYLKDYSPDSITKSVRVWDESVKAMWKIMGFDKYPQPHNNRQLGVSVEGGAHMFATWYYCGYSIGDQGNTLKNEVLAPGVLQGNRLWGICIEIGHCYQHPFNWRSMSESSNNFFAQLILDQVTNAINGNEQASDMENPCKYLLSEAVKGMPFHDLNGWAKWGFAQYSFYLYFHKLGINPEFYPRLFESLRRKPLSRQAYEVSEAHLALYERICNISRADFTDDFEIFNWFVPIDRKGHQYGDYSFKMTEEMARASKARIAAKRYPKPKFRIAFLHQHGKTVNLWGQNLHGAQLNGYWTKYKQNAKLSPSVSASKKDNMIIVRNGENAAAFCVVTNGKVVGYYDRQKFDVSGVEWNDTSKVYAIPIQTAEPYKLIYAAGRS